MLRALALSLLVVASLPAAAQTPADAARDGGPPIYIAFLWHMHQPVYYPGETVVQTQQAGRFPFSLYDVHTSRSGPYTAWPARATQAAAARGLPSCGAQVSFSASLMQNLDALAGAGVGFQNWTASWRMAHAQTTALGNPRLDLVGFGAYHPLMPLIEGEDIRRQVAEHRAAEAAHFAGAAPRGVFPPETAFSTRVLPALAAEGVEWVILDNAHLERAAAGFPWSAASAIVEPNRADIVNPNPGDWRALTGLWAPTPVSAAWAHRPHVAQYVDPATGETTRTVVVPASRYLGNEDGRGGFGALQYEAVMSQLEAANTDPDHPILVVLHHDGDNFGGGAESYYNGNWDAFLSWLQANPTRFQCTTVQDYLDQFPPDADDVVHVADGSWAGADGGDPEFKKWLADPGADGASPDRHSWAVLTAATHVVRAAEASAPGAAPVVEARRLLSQGQASDYWYWDGSLGGLWDSLPTRAANAAVGLAAPFLGADLAPPTVFLPQREPYNPGATEWGAAVARDLEVWTYVYDASPLARVTLRVRADADGANPLATTDNETYAGGPGVGAWEDLPMTATAQPAPAGVPAATRLATRYAATVAGRSDVLLDYYVEAEDAAGRVTRSPIQHVWIGANAGGPGGGAVSWAPTSPATFETVTITVEGATQGARLHWGVNGWQTPAATYQPAGTTPWPTSGAVETAMSGPDAEGRLTVTLGPFNDPAQAVQTVNFVIHYADDTWDNNGGLDYAITIAGGGSGPEPFVMDGALDARAQPTLSDGTSTLWTAWNGRTLYLATQPASAQGGDTFLFVADGPQPLTAAPWAKAGQVAQWRAFAANESTNGWSGWFDADAPAATAVGAVFEATYDLGEGAAQVYVAAGVWDTADGGALLRRLGAEHAPSGPAGPGDGSISAYHLLSLGTVVGTAPPPAADALAPLAPNPSAGEARTVLTLARAASVTAEVVDVLGRRVALLHEGPLPAGAHALTAAGLAPGVYVLRVTGAAAPMARRLTVVR